MMGPQKVGFYQRRFNKIPLSGFGRKASIPLWENGRNLGTVFAALFHFIGVVPASGYHVKYGVTCLKLIGEQQNR